MIRTIFLLVLTGTFLVGCTSGGSDDGDSGNNPTPPAEGAAGDRSFNTECGTVVGGTLRNPVEEQVGFDATVTSIVSHTVVVVSRPEGEQLVRLRGLRQDIPAFQQTRARNFAREFLGSAVLFTDGCSTTVAGGGQGVVGDIFRASDGRSLSEFLILNNAGDGDTSGACEEAQVGGCLVALAEEVQPETGATINNFLWKPVAERDGNLVVLLNPFGATVIVNGETLAESGPSNGRGTTARGNRPGAAYGSNITIQAIDAQGRFLVWPGGAIEFTIPNGANRLEF